MKRLFVVVVMVCMLTSPSLALAKVPITLWLQADNVAIIEWAKAYQARFNAENPDIDLHFECVNSKAVKETVLVASVAGAGPDISYLAANLIPEQINRGLTLPLNKYFSSWPDYNDIIPDLFSAVTDAKGQVHALPFAMWGIFELYNMNILQENAFVPPTDWKSMLVMTRKLTRYNSDQTVEQYGYVSPINALLSSTQMNLAMEQLGKGMIYMGDTKVNLNNEIGRTAATYIRDLWQAGMPDYNTLVSPLVQMVSGKVAVNAYATYNLLDIAAEDSAELEPRRVVGPQPGKDMVRYNSGTLYILPTSKHPNEAWRVISDFVKSENSQSYIKAQVSYLPVRKSVLAKMRQLSTHPMVPKMAALMYSPMTTYGAVHGFWATIREVGGAVLMPALQNNAGIEDALAEAERKMNATLAEKLGVK